MTGPEDTELQGASADEDAPKHLWDSREVRWSALSGLLLAVGFALDHLGDGGAVVTAIYIASTVAGLRFFAVEAVSELIEERVVGIELLMTVAALVAGVLGLWEEAAALAFLYSISESLEEFTEDRTRGAIRALMDLAPKRVTRLVDGREEEVDLDAIVVGDRFLVRPGQGIATDGTVLEGGSAVNEAAVTGESVPVEKVVGDKVVAGTLNTTGALEVEATATAADNTLARIVHLVTEAQEEKGRGEQFMSQFSRRYSPAVLFAGAAVAVIGGLVTGDWSTWAERAATVIVAAALCAGDRDPDQLRGRHRQRQPQRHPHQGRHLSRGARPAARPRARQDRNDHPGRPPPGRGRAGRRPRRRPGRRAGRGGRIPVRTSPRKSDRGRRRGL